MVKLGNNQTNSCDAERNKTNVNLLIRLTQLTQLTRGKKGTIYNYLVVLGSNVICSLGLLLTYMLSTQHNGPSAFRQIRHLSEHSVINTEHLNDNFLNVLRDMYTMIVIVP